MSPKIKYKPPREIYRYQTADSEALSASLQTKVVQIFKDNPENNTVESNWLHFKILVETHMENIFLTKFLEVSKPIHGQILKLSAK